MKKKCAISLAYLVICSLHMSAQNIEWKKSPLLHDVPQEYSKESAVIIEDMRMIDYKAEAKDIVVYRTVHRIVKVLDERGVEGFNKAYIPVGRMGVESIKARTITKDNHIHEVSGDKIKKTKSEDGRDVYLIAFEGVEKGTELELLYVEKKPFSVFGSENLQYGLPVLNAGVILSVPERFRFETKGYNGFPGATNTLIDGRYIHKANAPVKEMKEEAYSNSEAMGAMLSYRLGFIMDENPDVRMFTWSDMIKKVYARYYTFSDKEKRAVEKFLESSGVKTGDSENDKIRKIEDAIKNSIQINENLDDEQYVKIDKTLSEKATTETGVVRLYACCFTLANVKHELGLTSNRFTGMVDEEFEYWNMLEEYLIYFPNEDKYMAPISIYYRCPMIPTLAFGNKGVFCKVTSIGNLTSAIPSIREIPYLPADSSHNDIAATVSFTPGDLEPKIDITASFSGYSAYGIRELSNFVPKDKEKEFVQQMLYIVERPENLLSYKITGSGFDSYYNNAPLMLNAQLKAPQLVEKAGNKYLFKIGEIIGNQQELYQTEQRQRPINLPYPHVLYRSVTVDIPAGYKIMNPESLNINAEGKSGQGTETVGFHSSYKIDAGKLYIDIKEFYTELNYEIGYYDVFAKVINAAADFNKVVLVMEKE